MYAVELWATCPRVIGQHPVVERLVRRQTLGSKMEIAAFICFIVLLTALPAFFMVR
jgi:hypothetical protein